ncbi:alpha/beta hydrolase [Flavicella sediminum]|uniref:alpha/beta hydrolase n=1 Tax=Flavicella sediminum TaxID=2585141 RepID=UPI00111DD11A|nr:alpha/beta hydrolase-fold protein [Flavicella sediminum]
MKNPLLFLYSFFVFSFSFAQDIIKRDVNSAILNEIKEVKLYIPENYFENDKFKYPLTIVLDEGDLFDSYVGISKLYAKKGLIPEQIIVGVSQDIEEFKERDYGYNMMNSYPTNSSMNVFKYIGAELVPFIEKYYRISNFYTIIGNEITANFNNYFLLEKRPLFNAYININPYYAPDMPDYIKTYAEGLGGRDFYYYLSLGKHTKEKVKETILDVDLGLSQLKNNYFKYKLEAFENSSKIVAIPQSIASAIDFIFTTYSPISEEEFKENIEYLTPQAAIEYLLYKYEYIEYLFGKKVPIRKDDFIAIESLVMEKENGTYLKKLSDLALKYFPKDELGDYYLGMYYEKKEDYREALLAYKKGYRKIPEDSPYSLGFFKNIKRIADKQLQLQQEAKAASEQSDENLDESIDATESEDTDETSSATENTGDESSNETEN